MKTKPIPESWHKFHRLVDLFFNDSDYSLTKCVQIAGCSARMPRIYVALGWITPRPEINRWFLPVSSILTPEMAEQIRAESKRMENADDPLGLIKEWRYQKGSGSESPKGIAAMTSGEIATFRIDEQMGWKMPTLEETKEKIMEKRAKELKKFWDADLVSELRRRGYEVTAKKTVEL